MTQLHNILGAVYTEPAPSTVMSVLVDATIEQVRDEFTFIYRPEDPFGDLNPQITAWFFDHPEFEIEPYVEPPEPEPVDPLTIELPRREFRRALLHNGMDTATILSVINAISDPTEREEMQIWWEDTQSFQRQHPVLVQMVAAAGLTPEQGDVIWTYGVGLLHGE